MLKEALGQKDKKTASQKSSLNEKLVTLQNRLANLQDMFADKQISVSEYQNLKSKYEVQLVEVKSDMTDVNGSGKEMDVAIEKGIAQLKNLSQHYSEISLERKTRLLGSIFPEKFVFENSKYRTTNLCSAILLYLHIDKGLREKKTGQLSEFLELSGSVPRTGIEPVRHYYHRFLRPTRLPIPPPGHFNFGGPKVGLFYDLRKLCEI